MFWLKQPQAATFDLNPEQKTATYNILPLVLDPNAGNSTYETLLTNMLMDQGYEAHCSQKEVVDATWGTSLIILRIS